MKFEQLYAGISRFVKIWKILTFFLTHLKPKAYHGKTGVAKRSLEPILPEHGLQMVKYIMRPIRKVEHT